MSDVAAVTEHASGVLKFYLEDKGYGFIERDGQTDVFVHANELKRAGIGAKVPPGAKLEFDIVVPDNGKGPKAVNIKQVG